MWSYMRSKYTRGSEFVKYVRSVRISKYTRSIEITKYFGSIRGVVALRTFLLINLVIVFANAFLGNMLNLSTIRRRMKVTNQYTNQERRITVGSQELDDLVTKMSLNYTQKDTGAGSGVGNTTTEPPKNLVLKSSRGILDKSGEFKTHTFVITAKLWDKMADKWRVCLSTQASPDRLFNIAEQSATWTGPMSVSVLVPAEDYTVALKMINYLRECFPAIRERATFHMAYPYYLPPRLVPTESITNPRFFNCTIPEEVNKLLVKEVRSERLKQILSLARYPQNLLRNLARRGCQSEYVFTPDVDMISSPTLSDELNEFLGRNSTRNCEKCAYILPVYEISVNVSDNPKDKNELVQLTKKGLAQRFHIRVFKPNQGNSQLHLWERVPRRPQLDVLYTIKSWQSHWEPIYVTKATVPSFDERFVGYGYTRNTQVYEMHVAGYRWHMLNNGFLTHKGFQTAKTYSKIRRKQVLANARKFKAFKRELYARYGMKEEMFESKKRKKWSSKKKTKASMKKEAKKKTEEEARKKEEGAKKKTEEEANKKEEEEAKKKSEEEEKKTEGGLQEEKREKREAVNGYVQ